MTRTHGVLSLVLALFAPNGCALLSKSDPLTPRYFSPEPTEAPASGGPASNSVRAPSDGSSVPELRLGRVTSASYLGERLVYRSSGYELGFYEDLRWTEKPETYFRRALARALFEAGSFRHLVSGAGPTLDVELVELTELTGPTHLARARATYVLYDARSVRTEATVTVELPIRAAAENEQAAVAVGVLSEALARAVHQIVEQVRANLTVADAQMAGTEERK